MGKPLPLIVATGALALGVAACGGSSSHSTSAASITSSASSSAASASDGSPPSGGGASSRLSIAAATSGSLMFNTKTLHAKAGTVTITFTNNSPEDHNFTLARSSGAQLGATPTFDHGSKSLTLHLAAGRYTYYCSVPGHRQAGMQGTLTVS